MISYSSNYYLQLADYVDDLNQIYYRIEAKGFNESENMWLARSATNPSEEIRVVKRFLKNVYIFNIQSTQNISNSIGKGYESANTIISSLLELESCGVEGVERIIHIYYDEEYIYLIMGYYERIEEELEDDERIAIARMLIKIIYDMHKNHIVHNRINDNNVIITRDAKNRLLPVIVDFTNAVYVDNIQEKANIIEKNDIWNLGVYLYSLIAGDLPFSCSNLNDFSFKHFLEMYNNNLFLNDCEWDCYPEIKQIIIRSLNPDPKKRADVSELLDIVY